MRFRLIQVAFLLSLVMSVPGIGSGDGAVLPPADPARLFGHVQFLGTLQPARNARQPASLDKAAEYIGAEFRKAGADVTFQHYEAYGRDYQNVVASFAAGHAERVVIGAHYDVWGDKPGADDNASGVAGVLELARLLKTVEDRLPCRVDLAAYTLEELPYEEGANMGSARHAAALKQEGVALKLMVSLDMIGYFDDRPKTQSYPLRMMRLFHSGRGGYIGLVGRVREHRYLKALQHSYRSHTGLAAETFTAPWKLPGLDRSDHRFFWQNHYRAIYISDMAFFRNPHYHLAGDLAQTLDYGRMAEVVNGLGYGILELETGPDDETNGS